ncbi:uncharacterized protein LOC127751164 [Frankliniella occidentalis]|uniref:Uncharacterized protein LOC127751164 n=1 Tax=Frankliniella occidentalis TaxID=133901 RepID=A0A9C6X6Y0_FRAOC|nr:uncharacterized protein LOC127751164 [Frankliniella occidentalis]
MAGEFYGEWLACIQRTREVGSLLAIRVIDAMQRRESGLLECEVFLPAVFLEPRYKSLLTTAQRKKATDYFQALSIRLEHLGLGDQEQDHNANEDDPASVNENETADDLEAILMASDTSDNIVKENNILKNFV